MANEWEKDAIADDSSMQSSVMMPKTPYTGSAEAVRSVAQGATFGFADELEAAFRTGQISGEQYQALRDRLRQQQTQFRQDYPILGGGAEVTGALAAPFAAFKYLGKAAPAVQEAISGVTFPQQVVRGGATGAVTGALTGAGTAEKDVTGGATTSGIIGGGLGASVPLALRGAGGVIKNILVASGIGDQPTAASKLIADALKKDNLTIDEAQNVLSELERLNVPRPVLADVSKSLQDLAYSAYVVPSTKKDSTLRFLESRMIDQPNDIVKGLVTRAGLGKNVNGYEYLDFLAQNQKAAANAKYPDAYNKAIDARDFRKYVDRPVFQQAYDEAVKRAGVRGETLPSLEQIRNAQFVPTEVLHQMKIGLDRIVEKETDTITKEITGYGRDVSKVRKEFNDLIKEKNKIYAKANKEFADNEKLRNSFETGQGYQKLDYKEALDKLKGMNDSEKEAFRLGMMADVNSRLDNFKGGDFARQIFKSDKQKSLMRYAFTDKDQYNQFVQYVDALERQSKTAKGIIGGSQTGERLATSEGTSKAAGLAQSYATGGFTGTAMELLRQGAARTKGISGETSAELQKRLFSSDPIEQRAILQELRLRTQQRPVGAVPGAGAIGTLTGLL